MPTPMLVALLLSATGAAGGQAHRRPTRPPTLRVPAAALYDEVVVSDSRTTVVRIADTVRSQPVDLGVVSTERPDGDKLDAADDRAIVERLHAPAPPAIDARARSSRE